MNTDLFLCLKKRLSPETYTLPELAKELLRNYVVYKVFLLLNECGDPPFLFKNLSSPKVANQ